MELPKPRTYQEEIIQKAKTQNTLVVLPTGLGKTLIALYLAIHRIKQYPKSKILMLAPTRPLVEQHLNYFQKYLPELFADLQLFTGTIAPSKRKELFRTADIIFSTPQCIANDLRSSLYSLHEVSLLIIDEAHRCLKNYDYTHVTKKYNEQAEHPLILGRTASPGSDISKIKEICAHLNIQEIELRSRESEDVKPHIQEREFQKVEVPFPTEFIEIKVLLKRIYEGRVNELRDKNLLYGPANKIALLKLQTSLAARMSPQNPYIYYALSLTAQAIKIAHAIELLETQTLSGLYNYLKEIQKQAAEGKSKAVKTLSNLPEFNASLISLSLLLAQKREHPKVEESAVLIENELKENKNAKIILFTQFRQTAATLHHRLSQIEGAKPVMFIGQAKKNNLGLSQKEQKAVIEEFKSGEKNILIATSIGEEGLDIPEVNAVIFYEPIPSAIRKIQRCLPRDSKILMSNGTYKKIYELTIGEEVVSFNEKKGVFEHKKITKKYSNREKDLIEITTEKNNKI